MKPRLSLPLASAIAALLATPSAKATTYYWDTNGADGFGAVGPFTWTTANNFWNTDSTGATSGTFVDLPTNADDLNISAGTTGDITIATTGTGSSLTISNNVAITLTGGTLALGGTGTQSGLFITSAQTTATGIASAITLNTTTNTIQNAGTGVLSITGGITGAQNLIIQNNGSTAGGIAFTTGSVNNGGSITNSGSGGGVTISSVIGSNVNGGLIQNGASALTLNTSANLYTGGTTITSGIINANVAGSLSTGTVANNGTLNLTGGAIAYTFGAVSGSGTTNITLGTTSATTTFTNATWSGYAGTINVGVSGGTGGKAQFNSALSSSTTVNVTANSTFFSSAAVTHNAALTLNGGTTGETLGQLRLEGGAIWAGQVTLAANTTIGANSGTGTIQGNIVQSGGARNLQKLGAGTITLSGTNSYTGNTNVGAGTLNITNAANSTTGVFIIAGTLNLSSFSDYGVTSAMGSRLASSETTSATDSATSGIGLHFMGGTLQYTGTGAQSTNRQIRLKNSTTNTIDASGATLASTLSFTHSGNNTNLFDTGGTRTLNLTGSNAGNNTFAIKLENQATAATSLTKSGVGSWLVTNTNNTFTGTITLDSTTTSAGTLSYASAGGTNPITFNQTTGSATLSYTGAGHTMSGAITASALTTGTITLDASGGGAINYSNTASLGAAGSGIKKLILSGNNNGNNTLAGIWANNTGAAATLTKNGTGTWVSSAIHTYTGTTTVNAGTLTLSGNRTATAGAMNLNSSGTAVLNLQGATASFATGQMTIGANGGNATVNHSAGTISAVGGAGLIMGNGTSTSNYNLSGGVLTLVDIIMGTNSGTSAAAPSVSTITVSGTGALSVTTLRIGRYDNGQINTTNTFTQTGGTTVITTLGMGGGTGNAQTGPTIANLNLTGGTFSATTFTALSQGGSATVPNAQSSFITIGGTAQVTLGAIPTTRGTNSTATITFDTTAGGYLASAAASTTYMPEGTFTNAYLTANGARFEVGSGKDITIGQALQNAVSPTAAGTLTKTGVGTLTLSGTTANTYTGLTTVSAGTLSLNKTAGVNAIAGDVLINGATSGLLSHTASNQIADVATVTMNSANARWLLNGQSETIAHLDMQNAFVGGTFALGTGTAGKLTVNGTMTHAAGDIGLNSSGVGGQTIITANTLINTGGTWTFGVVSGTQSLVIGSGGLTIGGGSTIAVNAVAGTADNFISLGGNITSQANAATNTISGAGKLNLNATRSFDVSNGAASSDLTISTIIANGSGTGGITKTGAGTLTLSGLNTYTGATNVDDGTLVVNSSIATSSLTTVAVGATLAGTGTVGAATINGILAVGNSPGQMNFTGAVILNGSTVTEIDGNSGAGVTGGHDFVNLTGAGAAGELTYGGTMTLDMGVLFGIGSYSWNLFDMASETGNFSAITLADQYSGSLLDGNSDGVWDLTSGNDTWQFTESTGILGLTVIPEPSVAILSGIGLLFLLRRRR